MKLIHLVSALSLAAFSSAQWTNQSAPFFLVLKSDNTTLNGSTLYACHEGAAIEGLCLGSKELNSSYTSSIYQFNTSDTSSSSINATIGETGILTWMLRGGNFNVSSGLTLSTNPTSNVAIPLFFPGPDNVQFVAFDQNNRLNIQGYLDDTKDPIGTGVTQAYYRWYICTTYWGYRYTTLTWVLGNGLPQNPTCVKTEVVRVWV